VILLTSASQVVRIAGVSHWHLDITLLTDFQDLHEEKIFITIMPDIRILSLK
jgi:hypothetical protein